VSKRGPYIEEETLSEMKKDISKRKRERYIGKEVGEKGMS